LLGPAAVTEFAVNRRAFQLSETFVGRISNSFMPTLAHLHGTGADERMREIVFRLILYVIWAGGAAGLVLLSLNSHFVTLWVGGGLVMSPLVQLALLALFLISSASVLAANLCWTLGNLRQNSVVNIAQKILVIIFLYFGLRFWGITGMVIGQCVALAGLSAWYFPKKLLTLTSLRSEWVRAIAKECLLVACTTGVIYAISRQFSFSHWMGLVTGAVILVSVYCGAQTVLSPCFRNEAAIVVGHLRSLLKSQSA
jgi:O-antigen/teichoic acid export membrane protein